MVADPNLPLLCRAGLQDLLVVLWLNPRIWRVVHEFSGPDPEDLAGILEAARVEAGPRRWIRASFQPVQGYQACLLL